MKLKKWTALALSAALATCMLTGCPWEEGDDASSDSPSSSSRPHHDSSDEDNTGTTSGEDTETPENPDQPEETKPTLEKDGYEIDDEGNYTVNSEAGLLAWAESEDVLNADCALAADITFTSGTNWTPIGNDKETPYNGEFDGQGHTISGLNVTTGNQDTGMFGVLSSDAEVKNLHLENLIGNGSFRVGGIAGANNGTITGCMVTGTVSGANYVGGVVGYNSSTGTVEGCCFAGNSVTASYYAGGVVGYFASGTVEDCYWKADTGGPDKGIGGVLEEEVSYSTTEVTDGWTKHENELKDHFTIVNDTPVPNAIANKDTAANNVYIDNPP